MRLGFMPLLDAAIPIVAARCGFAAAHGITIDLVRETSWANIRDRLAIGQFDAAHLLAPMPVVSALGLTPIEAPIVAPFALGLGGNAITVSSALWQMMQAESPGLRAGEPVAVGLALRKVVATRQKNGHKKLVFGVVHPFSAHNYELRYWLAASGIDPDADIGIAIVPPPFMPDALKSGQLDGFCVGEPWNSVAAQLHDGRIILTKSAIWRASPEKVLGVRLDWTESDPGRLDALLHAMIDAALWCADEANHTSLADLLGERDHLAQPAHALRPALSSGLQMADGTASSAPDFLSFSDHAANFPWKSHALWFLSQMLRWRQVADRPGLAALVAGCYRPDLYRRVASTRGLNVPAIDMKCEGAPVGTWQVPGTLGSLTLPQGGFFDQQVCAPDATGTDMSA